MTRDDVKRGLQSYGGPTESSPAFDSFAREMEHRSYGTDALHDAWAWYQTGWLALAKEIGVILATDKDGPQ